MAANVNNYISAGNAAVRKAVKARKALADNKARLDEIGMQAVTEAAKTAGNTAKNNALTAQATMDAQRYTKQTELEIEADKAEREGKRTARKAGLLGAGVGMLAVGAARMKKKEEPNEMLALLQKQVGVYEKRHADATKKLSDIEADIEKGRPTTESTDATQPTDTSQPVVETAPVPQGSTQNTGGDQWSRWSRVISSGEGTKGEDGYTTMFGHRKFTDMSKHPNSPMATPWGNPIRSCR